jgi:ribosome-associated heat shock protein Hsp15
MEKPLPGEIRIDKWLWAARFFKTRSAATKAVSGGKVHLGGQRVKAAKTVRVGDVLRIHRGPFEYAVTVESITAQRRPAPEARLLYSESEESVAKREQLRIQLAAAGPARSENRAVGRPNKKQRRQIIRFTRGEQP